MGNKTSTRVPPQPYEHFDTQIALGKRLMNKAQKKELIP